MIGYDQMWQHMINRTIPNKHTWLLDSRGDIDITYGSKIFDGRKILYLGIPGCFEPVSNQQLKDYNNFKSDIQSLGVDKIIFGCDESPWILDAWMKHHNINGGISWYNDGLGQLASDCEMYVDRSHLGLGQRIWRHFIILEDSIIKYFDAEDGISHFGADRNPYEKCKPHNVVEIIEKVRDGGLQLNHE